MHKSANLIPPYLHGELLPITHCLYDANEVGFHRHIRSEAEENDTENENPAEYAISSHTQDATRHGNADRTATPPPETDQLGDADIRRITGETRSALRSLMRRFIRPGRLASDIVDLDNSDDDFDLTLADDDDGFEFDDLDEDEDMELDLELDDDEFEDGEGPIFFEHNGEYYVQMYESETEEEDGDDEDDDEMHDAVETQQPVNDDVD